MLKLTPKPLIGLFYLFYFALIGIYIIFLPKILKELGFSGIEVGEIFSIAPMMRFLLPFIFRRFGGLNAKSYKTALFLMALASVLFLLFLDSFWGLLFVNMVYGASMGVVLPFVDTIALKLISKENYGKVRLWGSIGFMGIALWLGRVLETPTEAIYYLIATALATTFSGFFIINFDTEESKSQKSDDKLLLSKYWAWWLSVILFQISFGGFYNFFTIYETNFGVSLEMTTYLWSFGVICEIVMLYFQGSLLKKFSLLTLIEVSIFSAFFRWIVLWLYPDSLILAFFSQSLHALNFALYYTASIAYVYTLYSQKKLAQQFFLGVGFGLGGSIGAVVAGWVWEYQPKYLFLSQALLVLLAYTLIVIHHKRVKKLQGGSFGR